MHPAEIIRLISAHTVLAFLACQPILAQAAWTRLAPAASPAQRTEVIMASDGTGAVMYGGIAPGNTFVGDIWRFDGKNWTDLKPAAPLPSTRGRLAGGWDLVRGRLVIFGGQGPNGLLGDTWEYDRKTNAWINPKPAVAPSARVHARMAYELKGLRMIMFGGNNLAETWSWDGSKWTNLTSSTTKSPSGRQQVNMATNTRTGEIVLFGGTTNGNIGIVGDTWIWSGKDWRQIVTKTIPGGTGIRNGKMTYDNVRDRMVLYGGVKGIGGFSAEAWEFDGTDWSSRLPATRPVGRAGMGLAFVRSLGTTCMFSGYPYPAQNETWSYQTDKVAIYKTSGTGCKSSAGIPTMSVTGQPWIGDTLNIAIGQLPAAAPVLVSIGISKSNWGALKLPLSLGFLGAPGCNVQCNIELALPAANKQGVARLALPLPTNPFLGGASFYNQAFVRDPGANRLGYAVSNLGEATVGIR